MANLNFLMETCPSACVARLIFNGHHRDRAEGRGNYVHFREWRVDILLQPDIATAILFYFKYIYGYKLLNT